jgi:hypothetical protein
MKKSKRILKKHVMRYQYPILNLDEFHFDNWRKVIWSIYGHKSKKAIYNWLLFQAELIRPEERNSWR